MNPVEELIAARRRFAEWDERNQAARLMGQYAPVTPQVMLDALVLARAFVAAADDGRPIKKGKRTEVVERIQAP